MSSKTPRTTVPKRLSNCRRIEVCVQLRRHRQFFRLTLDVMRRVISIFVVAVLSGLAGYTLGHTATRDSAESAIRNHQIWRLRMYLLQAGSPNAGTDVGSLLGYANGEKGSDEAAILLINAGASVDGNGREISPLGGAMIKCSPAVISAVLNARGTRRAADLRAAAAVGGCPEGLSQIEKYMTSNTSCMDSSDK